MSYHPPKVISNNGATIYSADLAYEGHGKCGCQTIILSDTGEEIKSWEYDAPGLQPPITGCTDYSTVYKIVALENTKFRELVATNISADHFSALIFGTSGFILKTNSEIMANFTKIEINSGTLMLYRDCNQS